ncbi:hypothetical protein JW911_02580 [Candidatus Peregrinibacteria bacterium]|nr:hypothetical protein [Candidatus Peregrinibacteria bacterium]
MLYELAFLKALALTIVLECLTAALLKKYFGGRLKINSVSYIQLLILVALASALTLPYAWFILPAFVKSGITYILAAEILVTLAEAAFYWFTLKLRISSAIILSVAANAFSWFIGNVMF